MYIMFENETKNRYGSESQRKRKCDGCNQNKYMRDLYTMVFYESKDVSISRKDTRYCKKCLELIQGELGAYLENNKNSDVKDNIIKSEIKEDMKKLTMKEINKMLKSIDEKLNITEETKNTYYEPIKSMSDLEIYNGYTYNELKNILDDNQIEIIHKKILLDKTYKQIARNFGAKANSVGVKYVRIMDKLRALYFIKRFDEKYKNT